MTVNGKVTTPEATASLRARLSWAMFDWANQPYFTVITTFIFVPYFTSQVVGNSVQGQSLWAFTQAAAGAVVALGAPFLGAIADAGGRRKPWLLGFQVMLALACTLLWLAQPGRPEVLWLVLLALALANISAEYSIVFNNALLPGLVPPGRMGRLSGFGWGMGYTGGLIALFAVLIVSRPELVGITPPAGEALLGLRRDSFEAERIIGPATLIWLLLFSLPMFLFTPDRPGSGKPLGQVVREGVLRLVETVAHLRQHKNTLRFLIAYMLYFDGLNAVIAFGGVYAAGIFGWGTTELGLFGIALTVIAAPSVMAAGILDDRIGSKRTVQLAILLVGAGALGILSITADTVLFGIGITPKAPGMGAFTSTGEQVFFACAVLLGLGMGPMQAASRTMVARLAPPDMLAEFYGMFSLSGRATSFLAPLLIGFATAAFASQRVAAVIVLIFLAAGFILLWRVAEPKR
ncbi:MFS transporter [Ferrovibrio sp.]|uniref:MFS transporter n=1 Tax=Ferrovibrio sp. TaxID=1917215 RepID=UPI001B7C6B33|nr:MFS transporter [Ferrovibrio sp.]MBP7063997.1 MFS transporter [Ferrovibrio sp.]